MDWNASSLLRFDLLGNGLDDLESTGRVLDCMSLLLNDVLDSWTSELPDRSAPVHAKTSSVTCKVEWTSCFIYV